jgi:pyridinium-3,5-biscarboxylic acid mononucleotide sulfurtransferase
VQPTLADKERALDDVLGGLDRAVIAYSGGVDSTLLAARAHALLEDRALAVTAVSPSLARRERRAAADLAHRLGWNHIEVSTAEVDRIEYARNDPDRCYWCKTELFDVLGPIAAERNATVLVGTNADDLSDHRPGLRAARERSVLAPLADAGLTKADVRSLSAEMGLPTSEKAASPCLASRFAYGVRVTEEGLARVDAAEELVRSLGFDELRVRDHGDLARIEVPRDRIGELLAVRERVEGGLRELGYVYVTVDLTGFRSGAMNEVLPTPRFRTGG